MDKQDLLRFVLAPDSSLVPDLKAKLPGRGAYTCFSRKCLAEAIRRKQFSRAFKCEIKQISSDSFIDFVASKFEENIASYIALANKAGSVVSGSDIVNNAIRGHAAGIVIVASDVSADIGQKLFRLAERCSTPCYSLLTRDKLAGLLGKGLRSAVAISPGGFVTAVTKEVERFRNFSEEGAHE